MIAGARAVLLALVLMLTSAVPVLAQGRGSGVMLPALKPGQFVWYEQPALIKASLVDEGAVSMVVSIATQQAYVFRGGRLLGVTTVSTGSRGHETPTGSFTILQKKVFHRSNLYSNAPMPYMQRLTWTGIALHAGHLPGYPASHGCIRMPKAFARQLYDMTRLGGTVTVVRDLPGDPRLQAPPAPVAPPPPLLMAETRNLGGGAYDMVTMSDPQPMPQPASFLLGPRREVAQPVPNGGK